MMTHDDDPNYRIFNKPILWFGCTGTALLIAFGAALITYNRTRNKFTTAVVLICGIVIARLHAVDPVWFRVFLNSWRTVTQYDPGRIQR